MGVGNTLGTQLRQWLQADATALRESRTISNRLIDVLGAHEGLQGPIRDLANQPLLLQALHGQGANQRSALISLREQIQQTYAPAVQAELLDLLSAATGQPIGGIATVTTSRFEPPARITSATRALNAKELLEPLAPGMALAASGALVLQWLGQELDRAIFDGWNWSGGVVLVFSLGLIQTLAIRPWPQLKQNWCLSRAQASQPRQVWRWISHAWIHGNGVEAAVNLLLLLIILGNTPLPLAEVVLRYALTALACLAPAAVCARHWRVARTWSGASGPISALIALAAGASLLHWRVLSFTSLGVIFPAWMLLLVHGTLQLSWQLPRQDEQESSQPLQRLLCCSWSWGLMLGLLWAVISRLQELL